MFVDLDWPLNASSLLSASAELLMWLADVSSWSILTPRQVTEHRRSTAMPLTTKTSWYHASWYDVPRQVNSVFRCLISIWRHPNSDFIDAWCQASKHWQTIVGSCVYIQLSVISVWMSTDTVSSSNYQNVRSVRYKRNRIGPSTLPCGTP